MPIAVAARPRPLLPEAARSVLRALRQPAQHRSAGAGDAGVDAGSYAAELADATGRFYTQGMPEDTKASRPACSARRVPRAGADRRRREPAGSTSYVLDGFRRPALLLLRQRRSGVAHDVARARSRASGLRRARRRALRATSSTSSTAGSTRIVGETLARLGPDDLLVVMSDHGFTSWRRSFHLNSWLRDNGYLVARRSRRRGVPGFFGNVDWSQHARLRSG